MSLMPTEPTAGPAAQTASHSQKSRPTTAWRAHPCAQTASEAVPSPEWRHNRSSSFRAHHRQGSRQERVVRV